MLLQGLAAEVVGLEEKFLNARSAELLAQQEAQRAAAAARQAEKDRASAAAECAELRSMNAALQVFHQVFSFDFIADAIPMLQMLSN